MKKNIKNVLLILMAISFCSSLSFAAKSKKINFSKISKPSLSQTYKKKGLEAVVKDLYSVCMKVGAKYVKSKKNKNGLKVKSKKGKQALIAIIEATHHINETMDPGSLHYYGPAKLYKNFRVDMNLAIEKAKIPQESKSLIRSALMNSY